MSESELVGPGTLIAGRYRLERRLGSGASGTVFTARSELPAVAGASTPPPGTEVALKLIHRTLVRDAHLSKRFLREARLLRRIDGPNVARLLDAGEDDEGRLWLALEYAPGVRLDEIASGRPMPVERAVELVCQVCSALEGAHQKGIIHRDLKPANVLVETRESGEERVRVVDFGLGKALGPEGNDSLGALTEHGMVFGTPEYMAPEQARGDDADERADVYAVGVMLYELLTGSLPFHARTPVATMTAHVIEPVEPPSLRAPGQRIPTALEAAVMHALAKQPSERYPTAIAMATALRTALTRPDDVHSVAPPSSTDLPIRDTDLDVRPPSLGTSQRAPTPSDELAGEEVLGWGWIVLGVIAACIGLAIGLFMSIAK